MNAVMARRALFILILSLVLALPNIGLVLSEEDTQLHILIADESGSPLSTYTFYVGTTYLLTITSYNQSDPITGALVIFPWGNGTITTEQPWITIDTDIYQGYAPFFNIYADATGYLPVQETITVSSRTILLSTDASTIKSENEFAVTVVDDQGAPLTGATLLFHNSTTTIESKETDSKGMAVFTAPGVTTRQQYSITATKTGYMPATMTITVKPTVLPPDSGVIRFIEDYGLILIGILAVITSIWYVDYRNKKHNLRLPSYNRAPTTSKTPHKTPRIHLETSKSHAHPPNPAKSVVNASRPRPPKTLEIINNRSNRRCEPRIDEIHIHDVTRKTDREDKGHESGRKTHPRSINDELMQGDAELHRRIDRTIAAHQKKRKDT